MHFLLKKSSDNYKRKYFLKNLNTTRQRCSVNPCLTSGLNINSDTVRVVKLYADRQELVMLQEYKHTHIHTHTHTHKVRLPSFSSQQSAPGQIMSRSCNPFTSDSEWAHTTALTEPLFFFHFFIAVQWNKFRVISSQVGMLWPKGNVQVRSSIGYRHNITDRDKWSMDNWTRLWVNASVHRPRIIVLCSDWLQQSYLWPALFMQFQTLKATVATF